MGELVAYPDVPPQKIVAIYERSRREPIHGYGLFIELMTAYNKDYPLGSLDRSIHRDGNPSKWMKNLRDRLIAAGVHNSYVVDYPTLPQYRADKYCEEGWLVVLATGFNKKLITPLSDGLVQRVQEIIDTDKKPSWFTMNRFSYPNPKGKYPPPELRLRLTPFYHIAWNACIIYKPLSEQKQGSSVSS